jgi:hypothetical protein
MPPAARPGVVVTDYNSKPLRSTAVAPIIYGQVLLDPTPIFPSILIPYIILVAECSSADHPRAANRLRIVWLQSPYVSKYLSRLIMLAVDGF